MLNYCIRLSGIKDGNHEYSFVVNNQFFDAFEQSEITNAEFEVIIILKKEGKKMNLSFNIDGIITNLNCDLCASALEIPISTSLSVMLQENEMEDTDEILYIHPNQYKIDVSHLIFEVISLAIPSKREHNSESGVQCDKEMMVLLEQYAEKEENIDPRWEVLNKLKDLKK
ncbi:MAG: YceD family protein [Flavobacteriales bacterium]